MDTAARIQASHDKRVSFEGWAYSLILGAASAIVVIGLFGVLYPPPRPDLHAASWGQSIVDGLVKIWPVILAALSGPVAGLVATLNRGAHDARLGDGDK